MEAWRLADLHAYVDDCLGPDERSAFDKRMAEDPALARRAATWRAQNSAIRSAFDGEGPRAFPISIVRHQNEIPGKGRRPAPAGGGPSLEQPSRPSFSGLDDALRIGADVGPQETLRTLTPWRLGLAALLICLSCVWSPPAPVFPTKGLGEAATAAFRAFVRPGVAPVELTSGDSGESQAWLTARLSRPIYLPPSQATVSMVGARIAPYQGAPAAFVVYSAQEGTIGLLVRPLDAPVTRAPELLAADGRSAAVWTWRGQGFALVGDLEAPSLLKIATDLFEAPAGAAQAIPERGW
jgi:anti-sigma factor RsiW